MRTVVMFDIPTAGKRGRKSYAEFRKHLLSQGYSMEQFSVYTKLSLSANEAQAQIRRLREHLPESGRVTAFTMTDREYARRQVLVDAPPRPRHGKDPGPQLTLEL